MSEDAPSRRGNLVVLSAPSGAGKSSLVRRLVRALPGLTFSVSATTRPPRQGEREGIEYHFVDRPEFERMRVSGELLEDAEVHGNLYGTPKVATERERDAGRDVLLEIDVQGARQVVMAEPGAHLVFILPPSRDELEARIRKRGLDAPESIERRLANAASEVAAVHLFDHVLINDDLDTTLADLLAVVRGLRQTPEALRARVDAVRATFGLPPMPVSEGRRRT